MKIVLTATVVLGLWIGFLCAFFLDFSVFGLFLLTVGFLILAALFVLRNLWLRIFLSLCLLGVVILSIPLSSMTFGIEVRNQASLPITIYLVDLQTDKTKEIQVMSGGQKWLGLAHGEELSAIGKNNYFIFALDSEGKLRGQEKINIGNVAKSGRKILIIK